MTSRPETVTAQKLLKSYSLRWYESSMQWLLRFASAHQRIRGFWRLRELLLKHVPNRPVICTVLGNRNLIVNPKQDKYQLNLFLNGEYEPGTLYLMEQILRPGDVFVDIGANLGLMSIHAAALVHENGTVISFEPSPEISYRLRENLILNSVKNVEVHQVALGAECKSAILYKYPEVNIGANSLVCSRGGVREAEVTVVRLADCLSSQCRNRVRLVKIDVEGYELQVLQGARELLSGESRPVLCVEYGEDKRDGESLRETSHSFVQSHGRYQSFVFKDSKFARSSLTPWRGEVRLKSYDNVIHIPDELIPTLPSSLFRSE